MGTAEQRIAENRRIAEELRQSPIAMPDGEFDVILADPPWRYDTKSVPPHKSVSSKYPTMATPDICVLPVPAADNAACFMWATAAHMPDALQVMAAWGFEYKTFAVWVKDFIGMGHWLRMRHEPLLFGAKGKMPIDKQSPRDSVIFAPKQRHSEKPAQVYTLIESMFPGRRCLELFARKSRTGWVAWGTGEADEKPMTLAMFGEEY